MDTALDDYQRALAYLNEVEKVDFIHVNGDLGSIGSLSEFQKFKEYNDKYAPNTPVHLACGNHDAQYGTVHNVKFLLLKPFNGYMNYWKLIEIKDVLYSNI